MRCAGSVRKSSLFHILHQTSNAGKTQVRHQSSEEDFLAIAETGRNESSSDQSSHIGRTIFALGVQDPLHHSNDHRLRQEPGEHCQLFEPSAHARLSSRDPAPWRCSIGAVIQRNSTLRSVRVADGLSPQFASTEVEEPKFFEQLYLALLKNTTHHASSFLLNNSTSGLILSPDPYGPASCRLPYLAAPCYLY